MQCPSDRDMSIITPNPHPHPHPHPHPSMCSRLGETVVYRDQPCRPPLWCTHLGALDGGPQCRLSILRNGNVPCCYFLSFAVGFKMPKRRLSIFGKTFSFPIYRQHSQRGKCQDVCLKPPLLLTKLCNIL